MQISIGKDNNLDCNLDINLTINIDSFKYDLGPPSRSSGFNNQRCIYNVKTKDGYALFLENHGTEEAIKYHGSTGDVNSYRATYSIVRSTKLDSF